MQYEMMTVTPELAKKWLAEKNNRNRRISPPKVETYARDMAAGLWKITHQNSIAFYKDGNLADGQHRLFAMVKSGVTLDLMVWFGIADDAAYGIDAHKMRTTYDQIRIAGQSDWITGEMIAVSRMLTPTGGGSNIKSPQQIWEICVANKDAILFSSQNLPKYCSSAPVRAAMTIAYYHEPIQSLIDWCRVMRTGVSFDNASQSVIALRERFIKDVLLRNGGAGHREALCKMTMRSIKAYCRGEILTKIVEPKDRIYEIPA
jgi:hypothetical protein